MNINFKLLAIKVGYSYLNAREGYWEDGAGETHSYDSMDNSYLKNCISFVDRGIKEIKNDENRITDSIKEQLSKMCKEPSDKDVKEAKEQIVKLLKEKKIELKECEEKRKTYKLK